MSKMVINPIQGTPTLKTFGRPNAHARAIRITRSMGPEPPRREMFKQDINDAIMRGKTDFQNIILKGDKNLREADLSNTDFSGAILREVDLFGAILNEIDLHGADLEKAKLEGSYIAFSDLRETDLSGANLMSVHLTGSQLQLAKLKGSNLRSANLGWAKLQGAGLENADLSGADLQRAQLQGTNLSGTILDGAYLKEAVIDTKALNTLNTGKWAGLNLKQKKDMWENHGGIVV